MTNAEWMATCAAPGLIFLAFALIFALLKEKAAGLISGFNSFSKEKRAQYDRAAMAKDYARMFLAWGLVMLGGAAAGWYWGPYGALPAAALWLVLFLKDVHLDPNKAFEKYRL